MCGSRQCEHFTIASRCTATAGRCTAAARMVGVVAVQQGSIAAQVLAHGDEDWKIRIRILRTEPSHLSEMAIVNCRANAWQLNFM